MTYPTRIRSAYARYLERYDYDHFCHLTFRYPPSSPTWALGRLDNWTNGLARVAQRPIAWVAFAEETYIGAVHLHALLRGSKCLRLSMMTRRWRRHNGLPRIEVFKPDRGAEYYISKSVWSGDPEWDVSSNFRNVR